MISAGLIRASTQDAFGLGVVSNPVFAIVPFSYEDKKGSYTTTNHPEVGMAIKQAI